MSAADQHRCSIPIEIMPHMASPRFGGEQADSVSASVEQWRLLESQQQQCLKTSSDPVLPTTGFDRPPRSPPPQTILPIDSSSHLTITSRNHRIRILDDGFKAKQEHGSTQIRGLGIATSYHQILRAQCFPPRIAADGTTAAQHRQGATPNQQLAVRASSPKQETPPSEISLAL